MSTDKIIIDYDKTRGEFVFKCEDISHVTGMIDYSAFVKNDIVGAVRLLKENNIAFTFSPKLISANKRLANSGKMLTNSCDVIKFALRDFAIFTDDKGNNVITIYCLHRGEAYELSDNA